MDKGEFLTQTCESKFTPDERDTIKRYVLIHRKCYIPKEAEKFQATLPRLFTASQLEVIEAFRQVHTVADLLYPEIERTELTWPGLAVLALIILLLVSLTPVVSPWLEEVIPQPRHDRIVSTSVAM